MNAMDNDSKRHRTLSLRMSKLSARPPLKKQKVGDNNQHKKVHHQKKLYLGFPKRSSVSRNVEKKYFNEIEFIEDPAGYLLFFPTESQASDFQKLITMLYTHPINETLGVFKIIPPENWQPRTESYEDWSSIHCVLAYSIRQKIKSVKSLYQKEPSETLTVNRDKNNKATEFVTGNTLLKKMSGQLEILSYDSKVKFNEFLELSLRDYHSECPLSAEEFWEGLTTRHYNYGIGQGSLFDETCKILNVNHLGTLLDKLIEDNGHISGFSEPWVYIGPRGSGFDLHVEDLLTWSVNYLHWGGRKIWYVVQPNNANEIRDLINSICANDDCQHPVDHKTTFVLCPNVQVLCPNEINGGTSEEREDESGDINSEGGGSQVDNGRNNNEPVQNDESGRTTPPIIPEEKPCKACNCATCQAEVVTERKFKMKVIRLLNSVLLHMEDSAGMQKNRSEPMKIDGVPIPMKRKKDVKAMEKALCPAVIKKLKSHLALLVDRTAYKTALGMMRSLFTVKLMRKLNWEGKCRTSGKKGLKKLAPKFTEILVDAGKEAVKDKWTKDQLREKMMKVLVKSTIKVVRRSLRDRSETFQAHPLDHKYSYE